jgi:hypothetical protein
VSDVEVTFSGPSEGSMRCETTDAGTACFWPSGPVIEGTYLLQISASGYKPAKIDARMTMIPDPECGCTGAALRPSEVTLDPLGVGAQGADVAPESEAGVAPDASASEASSQLPACAWPTPIDAGPGACRVGRAYLECDFPSGGSCDSGVAFGPDSSMLCVSDNPTSCPGCRATTGTATCKSQCAPNQYAMECGGPPRLTPDGGLDQSDYQEPPGVCVLVGPTPSGAGFWCCPCQ